MKVIITSVTGANKQEALLDKDSGIIEYKNGEISHVLYEKQFNKSIFVVKDAPKEEPKKVEASEEQSKPVGKKKVKA